MSARRRELPVDGAKLSVSKPGGQGGRGHLAEIVVSIGNFQIFNTQRLFSASSTSPLYKPSSIGSRAVDIPSTVHEPDCLSSIVFPVVRERCLLALTFSCHGRTQSNGQVDSLPPPSLFSPRAVLTAKLSADDATTWWRDGRWSSKNPPWNPWPRWPHHCRWNCRSRHQCFHFQRSRSFCHVVDIH